jgi:NAD(P)-dependent dehydrogenase (short-subunit alcohol dehydrogenase family)
MKGIRKMKLENKTILVTGSNRGLGRALVQELLAAGVKKIYAAARDPGTLPDIDDARIVPLRLDITRPEEVRNAVQVASDVEVLLNNAGVAAFASLLGDSPETFARDMQTNYFGTLDLMRVFVPVLETKTDAAIVNVITMAAFVNFPMIGGYSASKAALFSASQGLRIELRDRGIAVHTVNPGPLDTEMIAKMDMGKTPPEVAARNILSGLAEGQLDIVPDPASQHMFSVWKGDYLALEAMVSEMVHSGS